MNGKKGVIYDDVKKSVSDAIEYMDRDIRFAMPLGLGKPNMFINELYRRAKEDPSIKLKIVTGLSLEKPRAKSEMEKRFLGPLVDRIFAGVPEYRYMEDLRAGKLPKNVEIYEFFTKVGGILNIPEAQRNHLHSNYAHVVRDAINFGCNMLGQSLAVRTDGGKTLYSMGCTTDIAIQGMVELNKIRERGGKILIVGEVNPNMPFMYGDAVMEADAFDIIMQGPYFERPLFGAPLDSINSRDYAIGLNVSTLIHDNGTIQIGIGSLGDAITESLIMRHKSNSAYNDVLKESGILDRYSDIIGRLGGTGKFIKGLYGSSEMLVNGFLQLYKAGILKRKVYDSLPLQKLVEAGKIQDAKIPTDIIELLIEIDGIHPRLREKDFRMLKEYGIFKPGVEFKDGFLTGESKKVRADFYEADNLSGVKALLGDTLKNGKVMSGAFFIGPRAFYNELNAMSEEERMQFGMFGVEKVNQLYGDEELRALQRKGGRFINAGMMAHVLGSITSDQLEDGRMVSGVGGQYNFVSMAHAIPDGRLIMMIKSTRGSGKNTKSNIVYNYGHITIPRHLRDIIVTEYGIADVRGLPDYRIVEEIVKIADSRFQDELIEKAKKHGKLKPDFVLDEKYRHNTPQRIEAMLKPFQAKGFFQPFPFGTDFTIEEMIIGASLKSLAAKKKSAVLKGLFAEMLRPVPEKAVPYLRRMSLDSPANGKEKIMRKVMLYALRSNNML